VGLKALKAKATLNQKISKLEAENGAEIAVVTVPETAPSATPKQFATELFKYWGIGKKGINNGVLFLISKSDRRVEIETGYGIEKILPNAQVGNLINQLIIPHFKQGDFVGGTRAGIQALIKALESRDILPITSKPQLTSKPETNSHNWIGILCLLGILGLYWLLALWIQWILLEVIPRKFPTTFLPNSSGKHSDASFSGDSGGGSWDGWGGGDGGDFGGGDSGGGGDGGSW
jgi:uncharacterized protein